MVSILWSAIDGCCDGVIFNFLWSLPDWFACKVAAEFLEDFAVDFTQHYSAVYLAAAQKGKTFQCTAAVVVMR